MPYDKNSEPVTTQKESTDYEENFAREEEDGVYQRRFAVEVETNTWYVLLK